MSQSDVLAGRYELLAPTTSDLEDVVAWTGRDQILDRPVHASLVGGEHAESALDDARRASLIADPRLPRILDVGRDGDQAYVVTEPWAGTALSDVVGTQDPSPLDPAQARAVVGELASVLESARTRGVHHLALRPAVVRLARDGVRLTGLGLDAALGDHTWRGAVTTARTDVVGLARVLAYALTGTWPDPETTAEDPALATLDAAPEDLANLCRTILTSRTAGPRTAGEVVNALGEWDAVVEPVGPVPGPSEPEPDSAVETDAADESAVPAPTVPAPTAVVRQSVRTSVTERATRPGTPPPAMPPRAPVARTSIRPAPTAAAPVPAPAPGPPPAPAPAAAAAPWGTVLGPAGPPPQAPAPRQTRSGLRFDPTAMTLGIMAFIIVVGLVIAWQTLGKGWSNPFALPDASRPVVSGEPSPTEAETTDRVVPIIASGDQLDPDGDDNEHPEAVGRAIDLDPTTYWYTRTYQSATYAGLGKSGIGYTVELEEPAPVSTVYLSTNNTGGTVEIRATSPDEPAEGELLWSGALEQEMEIDLPEPAEVENLVLWFTELPQAPDGGNRVELREISLA